MKKIEPTEEDGYEALRNHIVNRAIACREKYGTELTWELVQKILGDGDFVRFPVQIAFTEDHLQRGEFAIPVPLGESAKDGFVLTIRPFFEGNEEALVPLVLYHIPSINYLDIVTHVEAELFGAAMLGLEIDEYYRRICELADSMPEAARHPEGLAADAEVMRRHLEG
jgi:hypothetical protein